MTLPTVCIFFSVLRDYVNLLLILNCFYLKVPSGRLCDGNCEARSMKIVMNEGG